MLHFKPLHDPSSESPGTKAIANDLSEISIWVEFHSDLALRQLVRCGNLYSVQRANSVLGATTSCHVLGRLKRGGFEQSMARRKTAMIRYERESHKHKGMEHMKELISLINSGSTCFESGVLGKGTRAAIMHKEDPHK